MNRGDTKILIARQIAMQHGRVWQSLSQKTQTEILVLAENILATVERKAAVRW